MNESTRPAGIVRWEALPVLLPTRRGLRTRYAARLTLRTYMHGAPSRWVWTCGHDYWQSGALVCARRLLDALEGLGEPATMDSRGWAEECPDK